MSTESEIYETIAGLHQSIAAALGGGAMPVAVTAHEALASCFEELAAMKMEISGPTPPMPPVDPVPALRAERREGAWIKQFNISVKRVVDRPDAPLRRANYLYIVKDLFTVAHGSWDASTVPGSVDGWARDAYLKAPGDPYGIRGGGADHHLFGMVLGLDGKPVQGQTFRFWSDGFATLGTLNFACSLATAQDASGWVEFPIESSAAYAPERGEAGPWCFCPEGASEVVVGAGLPMGHHISTFAVWEMMKISD